MKSKNVDDYVKAAPANAQKHLKEIRTILKSVAPSAEEVIKWGMPMFVGKRILFSFSAYKTHMSFMPTGPSLKPFVEELKKYKTGKDTIQFPYDKPLPKALIKRIAAYRFNDVENNDAKWMRNS